MICLKIRLQLFEDKITAVFTLSRRAYCHKSYKVCLNEGLKSNLYVFRAEVIWEISIQ